MNEDYINPDLNPGHLRMALDSRGMRDRLAKILFPGEEMRFHLRTIRAFPWTMTGGGVVEYEVTLRDNKGRPADKKVLHAQLRSDRGEGSGKSNADPSSPLTPKEREEVLSGQKTLSLEEPGMVLSTFPLDHRLKRLNDLLNPKLMCILFRKELPQVLNQKKISISEEPILLGYRYGKRCTLEYSLKVPGKETRENDELHIIVKTYHDRRGQVTYNNLQQLWNWSSSEPGSRSPLIPKPLCYVPGYKIYLQEVKNGFKLSQIKVREVREEIIKKTAEILSTFHNSGIIVDGHYRPDDEIALLRKMNSYLMIIRPELEVVSSEILASIHRDARELGISEFTPKITHRDFYDKQVIIGLDGMFLTDLDTVTMSDQAIDVGNFMAHIFLRGIQQGESREDMDYESRVFLSAYQAKNPNMNVKRVMFYRSTSLFRLACLYAFRPMWKGLTPKLLGECMVLPNGSSEIVKSFEKM
jgi:hypothetical protein